MTTLISLFNHKGGVSKTTTTFNLGWALAEMGKKVLIVDGDPQCNLTGTVLGFSNDEDFEKFYRDHPLANISECLSPAFQGQQEQLNPGEIVPTRQDNLYLLAGHIDLSESETQLSVALSTSTAIPALQNLPGAISHLLRITAEHHDIDVVLIDMSPSVGGLNQCFLMGSDYFIVPTSPDYYCDQAIISLSRVIPRWNNGVEQFRNTSIPYHLPTVPPKFCGIISQKYRPRGGEPSRSYQDWIDRIKDTVNTELVPTLDSHDMVVSADEFNAASPGDTPYNLINIADFNTLIALSQEHNTPVFALSDDQIGRQGVVLETMANNRDSFRETFEQLAQTMVRMTHL